MKYDCLIIDDEKALASSTCEYFNVFNVKSYSVNSYNDAIEFLNNNEPIVILLDINLGDGSGFELCKLIRQKYETPILFTSARNAETDKLIALNIGGDDYIEKPYSLSLLLAKVNAVLRRYKRNDDVYNDSHLKVDFAKLLVYVDNNEIKLTSLEYKLLVYLISNSGRLIKKDELFDEVWEDKYTTDNTLNVHIKKLRDKIEKDPLNPEYILTIWKEGYRFNGK